MDDDHNGYNIKTLINFNSSKTLNTLPLRLGLQSGLLPSY
jgi:hypothetical protein